MSVSTREQEPVQQLAVQVDVVPDDVGVEGRDQRRDEADADRAQARADLEDDERCRDRHDDLRDPDREPRSPEREVDPREKPPVQRLCVRGRNAGQEAERAVVDERRREPVALVDELLRIVSRSCMSTIKRGTAAATTTRTAAVDRFI